MQLHHPKTLNNETAHLTTLYSDYSEKAQPATVKSEIAQSEKESSPTNPIGSVESEETATSEQRQRRRIERLLERKSFCTLSSVSPAGRPHAAGVISCYVDGELWIHTMRSSRKARNIAAHPWVGVCVPVRKLPVGPPFSISLQAPAELVAMDDPRTLQHLKAGRLKKVSGHGELEEPDGVFIVVGPLTKVHSYGIGVSTIGLIKDPLHAGARTVDMRHRS